MADDAVVNSEAATEEVAERVVVDILIPESCPPALRRWYTDDQRKAIAEAVEKGAIVTDEKNVKISKKNSGTGKDELWPFVLYRAVQQQGMSALCKGYVRASKPLPENFKELNEKQQVMAKNDAIDGACDYFNYGFGLTLTQPIRVMMAAKIGGTDKDVEKQIRQIMKTNLFSTEDLARAFVISQRKAMGMTIPDAFGDSTDDGDDE